MEIYIKHRTITFFDCTGPLMLNFLSHVSVFSLLVLYEIFRPDHTSITLMLPVNTSVQEMMSSLVNPGGDHVLVKMNSMGGAWLFFLFPCHLEAIWSPFLRYSCTGHSLFPLSVCTLGTILPPSGKSSYIHNFTIWYMCMLMSCDMSFEMMVSFIERVCNCQWVLMLSRDVCLWGIVC